MSTTPPNITQNFLHLGLGAKAEAQPPFSGIDWYESYTARHEKDGAEGRLVAMHRFTGDWPGWEVHPHGSEVVICISGEIELVQEVDGGERMITLAKGDYAINQAGVWHTANVAEEAEVLFITAGLGTLHRPR